MRERETLLESKISVYCGEKEERDTKQKQTASRSFQGIANRGNGIYLLQVHKGARHLLNSSLLEVLYQICQAVKHFSTANCVASILNRGRIYNIPLTTFL